MTKSNPCSEDLPKTSLFDLRIVQHLIKVTHIITIASQH